MRGQSATTWAQPITKTLAQKWNGKTWSIVSTPNPNPANIFYDVASSTRNDVWAVGVTGSHSPHALIEHWNGKLWKVEPGAGLGIGELNTVTQDSSHNFWAAGDHLSNGSTETLFERYTRCKTGAARDLHGG
jgi:hypothetical protein